MLPELFDTLPVSLMWLQLTDQYSDMLLKSDSQNEWGALFLAIKSVLKDSVVVSGFITARCC